MVCGIAKPLQNHTTYMYLPDGFSLLKMSNCDPINKHLRTQLGH